MSGSRSTTDKPENKSDLENLLPDIAENVLSPHLTMTCLGKLMRVSKSTQTLFTKPFDEAKILYAVFSANFTKANALLSTQPELMFKAMLATYPNGDKKTTTPLKLAVELLDAYMLETFKNRIAHDEKLTSIFYQQIIEQGNDFVDLQPLFNLYARCCYDNRHEIAKLQRSLLPYHMLKEFCRTKVSYDNTTQFYNLNNPPNHDDVSVYDCSKDAILSIKLHIPYTDENQPVIKRNIRQAHAQCNSLWYGKDDFSLNLLTAIYHARNEYRNKLMNDALDYVPPHPTKKVKFEW